MNRLIRYAALTFLVVTYNGTTQSATEVRQFAQDSYCVQELQKQIHALSSAKPEDIERMYEDVKRLFFMCAGSKETQTGDSVSLIHQAAINDNDLNDAVIKLYVKISTHLMVEDAIFKSIKIKNACCELRKQNDGSISKEDDETCCINGRAVYDKEMEKPYKYEAAFMKLLHEIKNSKRSK